MIRAAAIVSTLSIAGLLITYWGFGYVPGLSIVVLVAVIATLVLLICGYQRTYRQNYQIWQGGMQWGRWHFFLHLVPAGYLGLSFYTEPAFTVDALFLVPFMFFFWSGRKTWDGFYQKFGSRMYRVFYLGNTALLAWCPILLALAIISEDRFGAWYNEALVGYFIIHFLLCGVTMIKVERDFSSSE